MNDWPVEPLAWDETPVGRPRQGHDHRTARSRGRVLPLSRCRRRRRPLSHSARQCTDARRFFTRGRTTSRTAMPAIPEERPDYVDNMHKRSVATSSRRRSGRCRNRSGATREPTRWLARSFSVLRSRRRWPKALETSRNAATTSTRCGCAPTRFTTTCSTFVAAHDRVFVVEQNRDAQLRTLLADRRRDRPGPARPDPIYYDGTPITARFIVKAIGDMLDLFVTLAPPAMGAAVTPRMPAASPSRR